MLLVRDIYIVEPDVLIDVALEAMLLQPVTGVGIGVVTVGGIAVGGAGVLDAVAAVASTSC